MGFLETHIPHISFLRKWIDWYKERKLYHFYSIINKSIGIQQKMIVFMADGRMHHGGLSDRICGMVSAYNYCKKHHIDFRIYFESPFRLSDILQPAKYDWTISRDDISYNIADAWPVYVSMYSFNYDKVENYFENKLNNVAGSQIHLYTNARYFKPEEFSELFFELFQPVPALQSMINEQLACLPDHYISYTFRFQQLLGDFKEDGFPMIKSDRKRRKLMDKCICDVKSLHQETSSPILVTSDSVTFLKEVSSLDYVYVVSGDMRHMDYSHDKGVDISIDMKSFVDFFLLAHADCLYLSERRPLYSSSFPKIAAMVYGKPLKMEKV